MKFPMSEVISSIFRRQILGLQMRRPSLRLLTWLPFTLMAAFSGWQAVVHGPAPGLWHLLLGGWLVACWLLGLRLVSTALLTALLLAPLMYHFAVQAPGFQRALRSVWESPRPEVRVEGIVREREALPPPKAPQNGKDKTDPLGSKKRGRKPSGGVRLLLGNATVWLAGGRHGLADVVVELPRRSAWAFRSGKRVRIGGTLSMSTCKRMAGGVSPLNGNRPASI